MNRLRLLFLLTAAAPAAIPAGAVLVVLQLDGYFNSSGVASDIAVGDRFRVLLTLDTSKLDSDASTTRGQFNDAVQAVSFSLTGKLSGGAPAGSYAGWSTTTPFAAITFDSASDEGLFTPGSGSVVSGFPTLGGLAFKNFNINLETDSFIADTGAGQTLAQQLQSGWGDSAVTSAYKIFNVFNTSNVGAQGPIQSITVVPEPATWGLALSAAAMLGGVIRRLKRGAWPRNGRLCRVLFPKVRRLFPGR